MGCICCFNLEEQERYLDYLGNKYGKDVVELYKTKKNRPFSYFDKSPEHKDFMKRQSSFYGEMENDIERCCERV